MSWCLNRIEPASDKWDQVNQGAPPSDQHVFKSFFEHFKPSVFIWGSPHLEIKRSWVLGLNVWLGASKLLDWLNYFGHGRRAHGFFSMCMGMGPLGDLNLNNCQLWIRLTTWFNVRRTKRNRKPLWLETEIDIHFVISISVHKEMEVRSWMNFPE